jgi:hypothetical protein
VNRASAPRGDSGALILVACGRSQSGSPPRWLPVRCARPAALWTSLKRPLRRRRTRARCVGSRRRALSTTSTSSWPTSHRTSRSSRHLCLTYETIRRRSPGRALRRLPPYFLTQGRSSGRRPRCQDPLTYWRRMPVSDSAPVSTQMTADTGSCTRVPLHIRIGRPCRFSTADLVLGDGEGSKLSRRSPCCSSAGRAAPVPDLRTAAKAAGSVNGSGSTMRARAGGAAASNQRAIAECAPALGCHLGLELLYEQSQGHEDEV